ncbi:alpha,alpha-trehalase [Shewanella corallii]|uniref:Alpha,alpha-trehalase n=1 Tax=Shewanella corallii TaxID=560080 RepID=A0ABT0NAW8_9GAMM|nr:trehalase family glycosidase [Shewanella corallii]MCL2915611.1 alpha,alpha-trehalase [Shewanella corallii]
MPIINHLFIAVQQAGLFEDSKTFADAIPKNSWDAAERAFLAEKPEQSRESLTRFVHQHFVFADSPELQALPDCHSVTEYIRALWPRLARKASKGNLGSLLSLPHDYIVPGGRFNEIYYWDCYFTALGLKDAGCFQQIEDMLDNFLHLIATHGHVPNGNRSYYLGRSQPPIMALMIELLWERRSKEPDWLAACYSGLRTEYDFWMAGEGVVSEQLTGFRRVVRMPCGAIMNRYWDDRSGPRPESYREDIELACRIPEERRDSFYLDIRAACESGWDFSSRWLDDAGDLASIATTTRVPVDLNTFLYLTEMMLLRLGEALNASEQTEYRVRAQQRKANILKYCWSAEQAWFMDLDIRDWQHTGSVSLAGVLPMFANIVTEDKACGMAANLQNRFLKAGGLVTTLHTTGQQWDSPNGWAPLQWLAVKGLQNYQHHSLAGLIMRRWLDMVETDFNLHACLLEKYNVCEPGQLAGGGEYRVQQGFGWTNGITAQFYRLLNEA